jgi:hypothetical protein
MYFLAPAHPSLAIIGAHVGAVTPAPIAAAGNELSADCAPVMSACGLSPADRDCRAQIICAIQRWISLSSGSTCRGGWTAFWARSNEAIFECGPTFEDIEPLVNRLERVAARTNAAMLAAACIVGLAVVIPYYHPRGWEAWTGVVFWIAVAAVVAGSIKTLWRLRK